MQEREREKPRLTFENASEIDILHTVDVNLTQTGDSHAFLETSVSADLGNGPDHLVEADHRGEDEVSR
jgi:hypothetical protein